MGELEGLSHSRDAYSTDGVQLSAHDQKAVELFREASELESKGQLDDAISLYRKALQINEHVDLLVRKLYTVSQPAEKLATEKTIESSERPDPTSDSVLAVFPREIITLILSQLALVGPQDFLKTMVSSAYWQFPRDSAIFWEPLCRHQWPLDHASKLSIYGNSYFRQYHERPAVRFNGIYVSANKYWRQGEQRNGAWSPPMLEVIYYRYLRFSDDGTMYALLANEPPKILLEQFLSGTHKRIQYGTWELDESTKELALEVEGTTQDYLFHMRLEVASAGGKVCNKLKWKEYKCTDRCSGDKSDFGTAQERPFFFQKCSLGSHTLTTSQHQ